MRAIWCACVYEYMFLHSFITQSDIDSQTPTLTCTHRNIHHSHQQFFCRSVPSSRRPEACTLSKSVRECDLIKHPHIRPHLHAHAHAHSHNPNSACLTIVHALVHVEFISSHAAMPPCHHSKYALFVAKDANNANAAQRHSKQSQNETQTGAQTKDREPESSSENGTSERRSALAGKRQA